MTDPGASPGQPAAEPNPAPNPPSDPSGEPGAGDEPFFVARTQDDFNKKAGLERENIRNNAKKDIAEMFGYDDPAELDAVAEALKTWEDENTDELQKKDNEIGKRDNAIAEKDETIASLQRQVRRSAFIESIGLPNPRAAWGYILDGTVEIEWDENHKPSNLDAVRKALKQEDAALFGNGSVDGGVHDNGLITYQGPAGAGRIKHAYETNNT